MVRLKLYSTCTPYYVQFLCPNVFRLVESLTDESFNGIRLFEYRVFDLLFHVEMRNFFMQFSRIKSDQPTSIGQLLVSAKAISDQSLEEVLSMSKQLRMPSGRVMIMSGFICQKTLESALQAQTMIRNNLLNLDLAIELLEEAHLNDVAFEETLARHGWQSSSPTLLSELGELLVSATILNRSDLTRAIEQSNTTGDSLTQCLLGKRLVRTFDLMNGLNAFTMVRLKKISLSDAVNVLRKAVASGLTFDQALLRCDAVTPPERGYVRIGDLLNLTGLISDSEFLDAIETSLTKNIMVGELLVERKIISLYVLHCALEIQQMLYFRTINLHQARAFLLSVNSGSITLEQCISTCEQFGQEVVDLLLEAGIVTRDDLRTAHGLSNDRMLDGAELLFDQVLLNARNSTLPVAVSVWCRTSSFPVNKP